MVSTELIDRIVHALNEAEEGPRQRIIEIVQAVGEAAALELLAETERIEAAGGELVKKGSRKRTTGGVFFRLAKARMDPEARRQIFRSPHKPRGPDSEVPEADTEAVERKQASGQKPAKPPAAKPQVPVVMAARPRRRVIELGSVRTPEAPRAPTPKQALKPTEAPSRMVWTKPSQARATSTAQQEAEGPREFPQNRRVAAPLRAQIEPHEALQNVRSIVGRLDKQEGIGVLLGLLSELGYAPPAAEKAPESSRRPLEPAGEDEAESEETAEERHERVLCAVVEALGLGARELAAVLFRDESPSAVRKADRVLKRRRVE